MLTLLVTSLLTALLASPADARRRHRHRREDPPDTTSLKSVLLGSMPHTLEVLPNGLKVFAVKYPSPGVIAYQIPVRVGSRNEIHAGKTGFAHFFEHLMFRGTKNRSGKEFGDLYTKLGVENNAWTWYDMTNYHGMCSPKVFEQILDAESDRFMNLYFDEKGLRDEAGAVLGEYNKDNANPDNVLEEKLDELAFTKHPYAHTTMGYKKDILKFGDRYNDVWPFFRKHYRPLHTSVVIVGDIEPRRAVELVKKYFMPWRNPLTTLADSRPEHIPTEPVQTEPREKKVSLDKPTQTRIAVAYKIPAYSSMPENKSDDYAALEAIGELAFSDVSPFAQKYRYDLKWVDSISAPVTESIDPSLWRVQLKLSDAGKSHESELIQAVQDTLNGLANEPVANAKLADARNRLVNGRMANWFSSPETLAAKIAWFETIAKPEEIGYPALDHVVDAAKKLKPADVQSFAKAHLIESQRNVLILRGSN